MVVDKMKVFDVQQILKRFGTVIYTGNRLGDIELMIEEIKELHETKLLEASQFQEVMLVLQSERRKEKLKRNDT
jgi:uncharacterized protein YqgQ